MLDHKRLLNDLFSLKVPAQFENTYFIHYGHVENNEWKWSENIYNASVYILAEMVIDLYKHYLFSRTKR